MDPLSSSTVLVRTGRETDWSIRWQILWNQGIFQTVLLGKALQAVFLGELRLIEVEVRSRGFRLNFRRIAG